MLAHLSFLQVEARLIPGYDGALGFRVDPVLWTLSVEVAFYVVLPLVVMGFLRRPLLWLLVAVAGTVALRALALGLADAGTADRLLSLPPMYAADFAAGMAGAWLYARGVTIRGWMAAARARRGARPCCGRPAAPTADAARLGARQSLWLAVATPAAFGALVLHRRRPRAWHGWADNPRRALAREGLLRRLPLSLHGDAVLPEHARLRARDEPRLRGPARRRRGGLAAAGYASWRLVEEPARRRVRQAQFTYAAR